MLETKPRRDLGVRVTWPQREINEMNKEVFETSEPLQSARSGCGLPHVASSIRITNYPVTGLGFPCTGTIIIFKTPSRNVLEVSSVTFAAIAL